MKRDAPAMPPASPARLTGLAPLARADARVLILGSMPGVASLQAQQYYAHPQNRFWPLLSAVIGVDLTRLPYEERVCQLLAAGIAVWDVLQHCERAGSLDSAIVRSTEIANDFVTFFAAHGSLTSVFLNGTAAAQAFGRHVQPRLASTRRELVVTRLPSTSPANASQPSAHKQAEWMRVRDALGTVRAIPRK